VLFLHGGGQNRYSWGETAQTLTSNGFYPITVDLKGHGESEYSGFFSFSVWSYFEILYILRWRFLEINGFRVMPQGQDLHYYDYMATFAVFGIFGIFYLWRNRHIYD
jgi:pimeloyl-ACP methyl ester carboxylesterase